MRRMLFRLGAELLAWTAWPLRRRVCALCPQCAHLRHDAPTLFGYGVPGCLMCDCLYAPVVRLPQRRPDIPPRL